jgi:glutathione S-transferase
MRLIGMLDSPYVRRVAVCLDLLGVPFEHEAVSVFSTFERFQRINPMVKAPTLVGDDGGVLMDSSLILQAIEMERFPGGSPLWSRDPHTRLLQFRAVSHAVAATEKGAQYVYETQLRPASAQHEPWKARVRGQFQSGYAALEAMISMPEVFAGEPNHASVMAAIAWQFTQSMIAEYVPVTAHPGLAALSARFEALPVFRRYPPVGPGVPAGSA